MKVKRIKLVKLEDLQREGMYRDYLARLERDKQKDRQFFSIKQNSCLSRAYIFEDRCSYSSVVKL